MGDLQEIFRVIPAAVWVLVGAAGLDYGLGDPRSWLHPVQIMGWAIVQGQRPIVAYCGQPWQQRAAGVLLALGIIGGSGAVGWLIIALGHQVHPWLGQGLGTVMLASCWAGRSLRDAAEDVLAALPPGLEDLSSQDLSSQGLSPKDLSSQDLSSQGLSPKDLSSKDLSSKDLSSQDLSPKDLSSEDLPSQDLSPKDLSSKDLSSQDLSPKDLSPKDLSPKDLSPKDLSSKDLSSKDLSSKDLSSKDLSSQDLSPPQKLIEVQLQPVPLPEDPLPKDPLPKTPLPEDPLPKDPLPANPLPEEPLPEVPLPEAPLPEDPLQEARRRLAQYVGRDTQDLSAPEIRRAVLETVTENAVDGVLAPLFYGLVGAAIVPAVGSAPLALAYKAASTLDSMVGYRHAPYTHLGWFSARLEDVLTWVPCRCAVVTLALLSGQPRQVIALCRRDAPQDPSPNAGWSECVYAAALGVQMGGLNTYGGVPKAKPILGDPLRAIDHETIAQAMALTRRCFLLWLGLGLICASWISH